MLGVGLSLDRMYGAEDKGVFSDYRLAVLAGRDLLVALVYCKTIRLRFDWHVLSGTFFISTVWIGTAMIRQKPLPLKPSKWRRQNKFPSAG